MSLHARASRTLRGVRLATLAVLATPGLSVPLALAQEGGPPTGLAVERDTATRGVIVRWDHGPIETETFELWRGEPGQVPATNVGTVVTTVLRPLMGGLHPYTVTVSVPQVIPNPHTYRVRSTHSTSASGNSRWSDEVGFNIAVTPPNPMEDVRVTDVTVGSFTLTWSLADQPTGGDAVANHRVYFRYRHLNGSLVEPGGPCATTGPAAASTSCVVPNVADPRSDDHQVWVVTEDVWGDVATSERAPLSIGRPKAPGNPRAVVCRDTVSLLWDEPVNRADFGFYGYEVRRRSGGESGFTTLPGRTFVSSHTDTGLPADTDHTYQVRAYGVNGPGPWSAEAAARTAAPGAPGETPGAPQGLAVSFARGFAELSWQAPASTGDCDIAGYRIERKVGNRPFEHFASTGSVTTFADFTNEADIYYTYRVAAVNGNGLGLWARTTAQTVAASPDTHISPRRPERFRLTPDPTQQRLLFEWSPPAEGFVAVTSYVVARRPDFQNPLDFDTSTMVATVSASTLSAAEPNPPLEGSHDYRVFSLGQSTSRGASYIASFDYQTDIPAPPAVTNPTLVGRAGTMVTVSWENTPQPEGAPVVASHRLLFEGTDTMCGTEVDGEATQVVCDLGDSTATNVIVRSAHVWGKTADSAAVPVGPTKPSGPRNFRAEVCFDRVRVTWEPPEHDGGNEIDGYLLQLGPRSAPVYVAFEDANVTSHVYRNLSPGEHTMTIFARAGAGGLTAEADAARLTVTTLPSGGSAPGAPGNATVTFGPGNALLEWDPPAVDGGCAVMSYTVSRKEGDGEYVELVADTTETGVTDDNVSADVMYTYRIVASNLVGDGTPLEHGPISTSAADQAAFSVPRNLTALPEKGTLNNRVVLSWEEPARGEPDSYIVGHRVYRSFFILPYTRISVAGTATSTTVGGLSINRREYRMKAVFGAQESDWSTVVVFPPDTPPTGVANLRVAGITSNDDADNTLSLEWDNVEQPADEPDINRHHITLTVFLTGGVEHTLACEIDERPISSHLTSVDCTFPSLNALDLTGDASGAEIVSQDHWAVDSAPSTVSFLPGRPSAPRALRADVCSTGARVSWSEPDDNRGSPVTEYEVQRRPAGGSYARANTAGSVATSHTDTALVADTGYTYRVRAHNARGHGDWSRELEVQAGGAGGAVPGAPENLGVTFRLGRVRIDWDAPASDGNCPLRYVVERQADGGAFEPLATVDGASHTDADITAGTSYAYRVKAVNLFGEGPAAESAPATTSQMDQDDFMLVPQDVQAEHILIEGWISVSWSPPPSGDVTVAHYVVGRWPAGVFESAPGSGAFFPVQDPSGTLDTSLRDYTVEVAPGSAFEYRVRAVMPDGTQSAWSERALFVNDDVTPPLPVTGVRALNTGAGEIEVTWLRRVQPLGDPEIETNEVVTTLLKPDGTPVPGSEVTCVTADPPVYSARCEFNPASVDPARDGHQVVVRSTDYFGGTVDSAPASVLVGRPLPPQGLRADVCHVTARVAWGIPAYGTMPGPVTYELQRKVAGGEFAAVSSALGSPVYADGPLQPGAGHTYRVRASNGNGSGEWSEEVRVTTGAAGVPAAPGSPEDLTVEFRSDTARIGWSPSSATGGCEVVAYRVERRVGGPGDFAVLGTVAAATSLFIDRDIETGTEYRYRVVAIAAGAESPPAESGPQTKVQAQQDALTEATPGSLAATQNNTTGRVDLDWDAPASGIPVSTYTVGRWEEGTFGSRNPVTTTVAGSQTAVAVSLRNSDLPKAWEFRVKATDVDDEESDWSAPATFRFADTPPLPVESLSVTGLTDARVTVAWSNPAPRAGEPGIVRREAFQTFYWALRATLTTVPICATNSSGATGLDCLIHMGSQIGAFSDDNVVFVRSTDVWGNSIDSSRIPLAIGRATPPLNLQADVCSTRAALSWNVPADDRGRDITGYEIHRKVGGGEYARVGSTAADTTSLIDDVPTPDTTYTYRVRAVNVAGPGAWSAGHTVSSGPAGGGVPGAPQNPRVAASHGSFAVHWDPPAGRGECEITYRIERQVGTGAFEELALAEDAPPHTDTDVTPGTDHTYRITASNVYGETSATVTASIPSMTTSNWSFTIGTGDGFFPTVSVPQGASPRNVTVTVRAEAVIHEDGTSIRQIIMADNSARTARITERLPNGTSSTHTSSASVCTSTNGEGTDTLSFGGSFTDSGFVSQSPTDMNEFFLVRCEYAVTIPLAGAGVGTRTYQMDRLSPSNFLRADVYIGTAERTAVDLLPTNPFGTGTATVHITPDEHLAWDPLSIGVTAGPENDGSALLVGERLLLELDDIGFTYAEPTPATEITSFSATERTGRIRVAVSRIGGGNPVFTREDGIVDRIAAFPLDATSFTTFPETGVFSGAVSSATTLTLSAPEGTPPGVYTISVAAAEMRAQVNGVTTGFATLATLTRMLTVAEDSRPEFAEPSPLVLDVGQAVSRQLPRASGGNGDVDHTYEYSWDQRLGLSVSASGLLTGNPNGAAVVSVVITATDSDSEFLGALAPGAEARQNDSATVTQTIEVRGTAVRSQLPVLAGNFEEGETANISVVLAPVPYSPVTVGFEILDGEGAASDDLTVPSAVSGGIVVPAGNAEHEFAISVTDDMLSEGQEVVTIRLTGAGIGGATQADLVTAATPTDSQVAIPASDPLVAGLSGPSNVAEGSSGTYRINLTGGTSTDTVTVDVVVTGDTDAIVSTLAQALIDPAVSFLEFTITATGNDIDDDGKAFNVALSSPEGGGGGGISLDPNATSVDTAIDDDDFPEIDVTFGAGPYAATEGGANAMVEVSLSVAPERPITIPVTVSAYTGGAVEGDVSPFADATFGATDTVATIELEAVDDTVDDDGEGVRLAFDTDNLPDLVSAGTPATADVAIADDDDPEIEVSFPDGMLTATEGGPDARVPVSLSAAPERDITVPVSVQISGRPDNPPPSLLSNVAFAADATTAEIVISAFDDNFDDDEEVWSLYFGTPLPNRVTAPAATEDGGFVSLSFEDNDDPVVAVAFEAGPHTATEGGGNISVGVTLDEDPERQVTVPISIAFLGGATSADIVSAPISVVFEPGETEQDVVVSAFDDSIDDDGESIRLAFGPSLPDNVIEGDPATAVVDIADNDADVTAISLGVNPGSMVEGAGDTQVRVTASLVGESTLPDDLDVTLTLAGTAAGGTDYTRPATLPVATIPAEQFSVVVSFTLGPLEDGVVEAEESVVVDADVTGYTVADATIALADASSAGLGIAGPGAGTPVAEGGEIEFEIELSGRVSEAITVPWSVTRRPEDVEAADRSGVAPFSPAAAGTSTFTITLDVSDDDLSEGQETVEVSLGDPAVPAAFGDRVSVSGHTAEAAIAASDPLGLSITGPAGAELAEGASAEFVVTVTENTSTEPVTVPLEYAGDAEGGGTDYQAPAQIVIAAGGVSGSFNIDTIADTTADAGEIVTVSLGIPTGGGGGGFNVDQPASGLSLTIVENTDAPQFANATETRSVAEHSLAGAAVGAPVTAPGTGLTYSLTGPDSGLFGIEVGNGQITVGAGTELDFEGGRRSYEVTVGVSDGKDARGLPDPAVDDTVGVGIAVTDFLDPPELTLFAATSPTNLTFGWDAPQAGPGGETPATYDVRHRAVGGDWVERSVSGTSLDLSDVGGAVAGGTGHEAQVRAVFSDGSDGPYSAIASARTGTTITVSMATLSAEVTEGNVVTGEVALEAAPIDPVTVSYELAAAGIAGTPDAGAGDRTDRNAGAVTLAAGETGAEFSVLAEDDNVSETAEAFIVRLTGAESAGGDAPVVASAPAAAATMTVTVAESDPLTVGFRSTTAQDVSEGGSVELTIDVTRGVGSADLEVGVRAGGDAAESDRTVPSSVPVAAGRTSVVLTVSATDDPRGDAGETVEITLENPTGGGGPAPSLGTDATVVVVTIVEDTAAPAFADDGVSRAIDENSPPGSAVGAPVTAPEPYAGAVLTYSLTGAGAALFGIVADSGQITLAAGAPLDHETDPGAYEVTVGVSDGLDARGLADSSVDDTVDVAITLADVDEPPLAPAAPSVTPVADVAGQTSLSVSWSAPGNDGRPAIDGYEVQYRVGDSGDFTSHTHSGTGTSATIGGLYPGTGHQVQVRAVNDEGVGAWSASGSGSTGQATVSFVAGTHTATEGGAAAVVSVTLSAPPGRAVEFAIAASPVNGAEAADYTLSPVELGFSASQTAGSVTVTADDDLVDDDGEGVTLAFGAALPGGYAVGTPSTASVAIADNDTASGNVGISASQASVGEGDGGTEIVLTATLGGNVARSAPLEVSVSVVPGGTAEGDDYAFPLSMVSIPAGRLEGSASFTFTPADDGTVEEDETVIVGGEADGSLVSTDTITITDNDTAEVSVEGPAASVAEAAGEAVFTVSLSHPVDSPVTVFLSTADGTAEAGGDYTARTGAASTVAFGALSAAGATRPFTVEILEDSVSEIEERLSVSVDSASSDLAVEKVTVGATDVAGAAIAANDPLELSLSGPATVDEGEVTGDYTLELTGANTPDGALVVSVTTSGSADAGDDYTAPVPVTIASGETSVLFSIATAGDDIDDDGETIVVGIGDVVSGGSGLTPESSEVTVETEIVDDDDPVVTAAFVAEDHSAAEAGDAAVVTVTLDADPERTVSYPLTAAPQGAATPADFMAPASVTFTAGMTLATFSVVAVDDLFHEPAAEGVSLSLGAPPGDARALVGAPATEEVALADNDDPAQRSIGLSVPAVALHENSGDAVINVTGTLGGSTAVEADLSVTLTIASETTATHNPAGSTLPVLVIGAGEFSATAPVTVALVDNTAVGPGTELVLGGELAGYVVGTVRLDVQENDYAAVSVDWVEPAGVAAAVAEGEDAVFEFSLNAAVAADVDLPWSVVIAGDVTPEDFAGAIAGTVSLGFAGSSPAGKHTVRIAIADDTLFEGGEDMALSLGALSLSDPSLSGRVSAPPASVRFAIAPDDSDRVTVNISGPGETAYSLSDKDTEVYPDVLEGRVATFTLSLSGGDATRDVSVPLSVGLPGSGHSAQGADFSFSAGPVVFPADARATTFGVSAQADAIRDAGEVVVVSLGALSGGSPDSSVAPAQGSPAIAAVTIVETNMLPSFPGETVTLSVTENAPAGSAVGDAIQAADLDSDDVLSYTLEDDPLTPGEDSDLFGIGGQSGQVTVAAGASLDFETSREHTVTVTARDGRDFRGITDADAVADASVVVVVALGDEPMPPPAAVEVSGEVDSLVVSWDAPATTISVDGYDVEHRPAGGSGAFTTLSTADTSVTITGLDRGSEHDVRVITRGGEGASPPSAASGTVPANNAPVYDPATVTLSVPENSPGDTAVGAPQPASDADGDGLGYSLEGPDRTLFSIAAGGHILVRAGAALDHESTTPATFVVSLVAADASGLATLTVTVSVTDVDEPPGAPADLAAAAPSTDGDTRLVVSWTAPDTAGRPDVSGYAIEHKRTTDPDTAYTAANVAHTGTETYATVSGLEAETDYDVRVRARNDEGDGEWGQAQGRTGAAVSFRVPLANGDPGTSFGHADALVLFYSLRFGGFLRANPRLLTLVYNRLFPDQTRDEDTWTDVVLALEELDDPGTIPADHPANVYRKDGSGLDHVDALMIFYSIRFGNFLLANPRLLNLVFNRLAAVDLTDEELADLVRAAADLANTL